MWRFEEGQLSFADAMQETSSLHARRLQYEDGTYGQPPPPSAATVGNKGARENVRRADEKLREAQRNTARLVDALQPRGDAGAARAAYVGDLVTPGLRTPDSLDSRPGTLRTRKAALEVDNARLRQQVSSFKTGVVVAGIKDGCCAPRPLYAPRLVDGMGHEQMMREAQLRVQHNKRRRQLKGYLRLSAQGGETVGVDTLQIAARLAGVALPPRLSQSAQDGQGAARPQGLSPRTMHTLRGAPPLPGVPWRAVVEQLAYPATGSEAVKRRALELAAAKRKALSDQARAQAEANRVQVVVAAEDSDVSPTELRAAHAKIRDHFSTRFSQVRRGFMLLDEDSSGTLTYPELRSMLLMFNLDIPAKHVQKIIELTDMDGSGVIDYAEFARIISTEDICSLKT